MIGINRILSPKNIAINAFFASWQEQISLIFHKLSEKGRHEKQEHPSHVTFTSMMVQHKFLAIMQNMIFDSVFEVDSVLENKSDF